jgi:hypothetical protein
VGDTTVLYSSSLPFSFLLTWYKILVDLSLASCSLNFFILPPPPSSSSSSSSTFFFFYLFFFFFFFFFFFSFLVFPHFSFLVDMN